DREIPAGTGRGSGLVEQKNRLAGDVKLALQSIDKLGQVPQLGGGRNGAVEIADDADADAGRVDAGSAGRRGGGDLLVPALADLDLAIDAAIAVSDDEMIAQAAAGLAQRNGVSRGSLAGMNIDVSPARGSDRT